MLSEVSGFPVQLPPRTLTSASPNSRRQSLLPHKLVSYIPTYHGRNIRRDVSPLPPHFLGGAPSFPSSPSAYLQFYSDHIELLLP